MKLLLIQSPSVEDHTKERVYPIGIVILATIAKNLRHEVAVVDMNWEDDGYAAVKNALAGDDFDLVGISLRNIDPLANKNVSLVPPFLTVVSMVRALSPRSKLIVGGTAFSLFAKELMTLSKADFGLIGEGEIAFPKFLSAFPDLISDLPGLCYYENGRLRINHPRPMFDLKEYVSPDYSILPPDRYADINQYVPAIGVETRRGCPLKCAYCSYPMLQGTKIRCRPVKDIVDEIEVLFRDYGIRLFHLNDPVVNMPSEHLDAICREVLRRDLDIQWTGFFRENFLNEKNVKLYVKSGCNCFSLSPDGLSEKARVTLGKDLTEEELLRAARLLADTGVCSLYHFMVNVPGENEATVAESRRMIDTIYRIHEKSRSLGYVVLNHIRLLPETESTRIAVREGVIEAERSLLYPFYYNPQPYEDLRYELEIQNQKNNIFMWYGLREGETP
ncbi:MAG TPA: B12 lower ligand biosynthesis radical SAM protein BzaD [Firmicutes bacterium]|nr:B12 lower ligand biosynthesis radical SAM protein BzaD [Bacillota bacterium]